MAVDSVRWFEHPNSSDYLYTPDFHMDVWYPLRRVGGPVIGAVNQRECRNIYPHEAFIINLLRPSLNNADPWECRCEQLEEGLPDAWEREQVEDFLVGTKNKIGKWMLFYSYGPVFDEKWQRVLELNSDKKLGGTVKRSTSHNPNYNFRTGVHFELQ